MASSVQFGSVEFGKLLELLDKLGRKGYDIDNPVKSETVIRDGIEFTKVTVADRDDSQKAGKVSRFVHGAGGVLGTFLNVSGDFRESTFGVASKGRREAEVLTGGTDPLDRERVAVRARNSAAIRGTIDLNNYDLRNPAHVRQLLQDPGIQNQLISDGNGNSYLPIDNKSFILVPQGDVNKATVVPTRLTSLIVRLGYDPKIRSSIKAYLERPDIFRRLIEKNGNYYLQEERRDGTSSFLFVPKGDFSKACSIKVSNSKTGEPLSGDAFDKMMFTYGKQYENMIKGMEKNAKERATRAADKLIKNGDLREDEKDSWIEREQKRILKSFRVAVMSPRGDHTRLYGRVDPNAKDIFGNRYYNSPMGGIRVDWDKPTAKEIKELWEKKPDSELKKERPFADSASTPPPTQPMPPQPPHFGNHGLGGYDSELDEEDSPSPLLDPTYGSHSTPVPQETLDLLPDVEDEEYRDLMAQPYNPFGSGLPETLY